MPMFAAVVMLLAFLQFGGSHLKHTGSNSIRHDCTAMLSPAALYWYVNITVLYWERRQAVLDSSVYTQI